MHSVYSVAPANGAMFVFLLEFRNSKICTSSYFLYEFTQPLSCKQSKDSGLPCYLLISGGRIVGFIAFPKISAWFEMQTVSFRIWTWVAEFISNGNYCYATCVSASYNSLQHSKLKILFSWVHTILTRKKI